MKYHPYLLVILCVKRHIAEDAYQLFVTELKEHGYFTFKELKGVISPLFDMFRRAYRSTDKYGF